MKKQNRDFKGIWIPKEIWLNTELTMQEKVFLVEISSLDNEDGCFAGNQYFAEFFGISKTRVSLVIKNLIDKNYITSEIIYKKGTKQILKRVLKVCYIPYITKVKDPIQQKLKDNNITNNTSNINNNIINNIITSDKKSKDLATINNTEDTPLTSLLGEEVEKEPVEKPVENSEKSVEQELSANIKEIYTLYAKNNPLLIWGSSSFFVARNIIKKQIELYGFDEIKRVTKWILENKDLNEYIPKINKPYDLSQKWNSVQDAMKRNGVSVSNVIDPEFTKGNAELDNFLLLGEKVCLYDNLEIIPEYVNGSGSIQKQMDDARDKIRDWLKIDYFNIERKKLLVMNNLDDDLIKRNETIIKLIKGKQNLIVDDRAFSLLK